MGNSGRGRIKVIDRTLAWFAVRFIRIYQKTISPFHGRTCLFEPTCSHRAVAYFKQYGFHEGLRATRNQLADCRGDYSLRLDSRGRVELLTHSGSVVSSSGINPVISAKLTAFDCFLESSSDKDCERGGQSELR
jgi:putative component of membrane protein insertase Oxa1/YidC/SpoIIIJ protein YidD